MAQRLKTRLPLLLRGTETQGRVVRVYMRETENHDFLFHKKKDKQYWEPAWNMSLLQPMVDLIEAKPIAPARMICTGGK